MNIKKFADVESDEEKIQRYLYRGRYLVVMDDMWNKKVWDEVKMLFPDNHNGSRIVITTRLPDVAAYPNPSSPIHAMKLLNEEESWILLERRVFGDSYCPEELQIIGKKIVKICEGLPLSIVLVAGLLSSMWPATRFWEEIAANDGKLETILCLSYTHLLAHERACFLYMGGFPEDYEIPVSELIKLCTAERFLLPSKNLERAAKERLVNLVDRSLVTISSMKSNGRIKSCSLHDMVRDFCIRQAQKEKLLLSVVDYLPSPILRRHFLPRVIQNYFRIWMLRRLRHLIAFSFLSFPYPEEGAFPLTELQTLSLVKEFVCSKRIINMIPFVKKLGICLCEEKSYEGYHLHNLGFLNQLEKLKLEMCSESSKLEIRLHKVFPWCLRKLTLSGLRIPWSNMTIVGSLRYLEVLKLRNYACDGDCWKTNDGEFRTLRFLLIDGSDLRYWITKCSHLPSLCHLTINRCPYLSEIPIDIAGISTNVLIEVDDQNTALLQLVKLIKQEQREYRIDSL